MYSSKKWFFKFAVILIIIAIVMGVIVYAVDPFYKYRVSENPYMLNARYNTPGLVKNCDYDTLLIGSSMVQNTDMDYFDETLNAKSLKVGISSMTLRETDEYIKISKGNDLKYYICADIINMRYDRITTPEYLFGDDVMSDISYIFNYEMWTRYLPVDTALATLNKLNVNLPGYLKKNTDIKYIGDWSADYTFGKDVVLSNYLNGKFSVSNVESENLIEDSKKQIDLFFEDLDLSKGEYNFFFPPYSSLYWYDCQEKGHFDEFLIIKEYFCRKAWQNGACVYDFQSADFTMDLENYKDLSHYSAKINSWMCDCFSNKQYILSSDGMTESNEKLRSNTELFRKQNQHLLKH